MIETHIDALSGSGQEAFVVVSHSAIGVRVGTTACVAHRCWMTRPQVAELAEAALRLLGDWPGDLS